MSYSHIWFEAGADRIALVTIDRPEKRNALNAHVMEELADAFERARADASIGALLVTGAGDKAFVAGADIAELSEMTPVEARQAALRGQQIFRKLETLGKPSVACINGYALGAGLELAMACTLRLACPEAKLGQPEVKLGLLPGYGGTQRLPRLVGRGRALDLLLSGEPVDAEEAHRIGLVNYVTPRENLQPFARGLLEKVLTNGPIAISLILEAVDVGISAGLEEGLRFEAAAFGLIAGTQDRREGTRAFLEKRKAVFAGK